MTIIIVILLIIIAVAVAPDLMRVLFGVIWSLFCMALVVGVIAGGVALIIINT